MKSAKSAHEGLFQVKKTNMRKTSSGTAAPDRQKHRKREDYIKKIFKDSESLMH